MAFSEASANVIIELVENLAVLCTIILLFLHKYPGQLSTNNKRYGFNRTGFLFFLLLVTITMFLQVKTQGFVIDLRIAVVVLSGVYLGPFNGMLVGLGSIFVRMAIGGIGWIPWAIGALFYGPLGAFITGRVKNRPSALLLATGAGIALSSSSMATAALIHPLFTTVSPFINFENYSKIYLPLLIVDSLAVLLFDWVVRFAIDKHNMHQAIADSEARLRSIFALIPDVIMRVREDGLILEILTADKEVPHLNPAVAVGRRLREMIPQPLATSLENTVKQAIDTRLVQTVEYSLDFSGQTRNREARVIAMNETEVLSIVRDITERKKMEHKLRQAEQSLRASEERFRTMADSAPMMLWVADSLAISSFVNKTWLEFTGRPLVQELGRGWTDNVHPEDLDRCLAVYFDACQERAQFTIEFRMRRHDGQFRWISSVGVPLYNYQGEFTGYVGTCVDIHDRKWAENILQRANEELEKRVSERTRELYEANHILAREIAHRRKAEERYRILFNSGQDAIFVWPLTDELLPGNFIEVNEVACKRLGYTREQLLAQSPLEINSPPFAQKAPDIMECLLSKGQALFETEYVAKDGEIIPMEVNAQLFYLDGQFTGISIARDIAERKKAEHAMLSARERVAKTEKLAFLGTIAAGIAHEINQPLNSVKVTADSLIAWLQSGKPYQMDEIIEDIGLISERATRIAQIIQYIRRVIQDNIQFTPAPCDLNEAVGSAAKLVGHQIKNDNVKLELSLAKGLPPVAGSVAHLEHIIINLLLNAIQSTVQTGKPDRRVYIRTYLHGNVIMEVGDNGCGIDEEIGSRMFEPLFTTKKDGMGLGLAIVQTIITAHNGTLVTANNDSGGATFRIELPVATKLAQEDDDEHTAG